MIFDLNLTAQNDDNIVLRASDQTDILVWSKLLHIPVHADNFSVEPELLIGIKKEHNFYQDRDFRVDCDRKKNSFILTPQKHASLADKGLWSCVLSVLAAALRGKRLLLMHGVLLETSAGQGILLCGDSGVGKSTTGRRWREAGQKCIADDMILLAWDGFDFYAHRLPTWSRLRAGESPEALYYPFAPAVKIAGVMELRRSEDYDRIEPVSNAEFFARICRSAYYFHQHLLKRLDDCGKSEVNRSFSAGIKCLLEAFPPLAYYVSLNGNLLDSLSRYC